MLRCSIIPSLSNMIRSQGCQISSPGAVACGRCGHMRRARHISIAETIGSEAALIANPTGHCRCATSTKDAGPSFCTRPRPEPARGTNPAQQAPHLGRDGLISQARPPSAAWRPDIATLPRALRRITEFRGRPSSGVEDWRHSKSLSAGGLYRSATAPAVGHGFP